MDRRCIAVVDRLVAVRGNADAIAASTIAPGEDLAPFDMLDGAKHAVFDAEVAVVFEEYDPVTGGEGAFAVIGLEREFSTVLAIPTVRAGARPVAALQPLSVLKFGTNGGIEGAHIVAAMRHGNPGAIGMLLTIGNILTHDLCNCHVAAFHKVNVAVIPTGGEALGRLVGRKGYRCLSLPIMALAAYPGKFDMANLLGNRPEGCTGPDRLQLLMVADKNDFCTALFSLTDEPGELPAPDHAGLVDDEHVTAADQIPAMVPAVRP